MNFIDRFAKISYWTTIIFVFFVFVIMPIMFIYLPDLFEKYTANSGKNPYNLILSTIGFVVIFLWAYCMWFWYENDKYSKSIFLLLLFNWLYAPIYYYRVKIKKRPLRNKIKKQQESEPESKGLSDKEIIDLSRSNLFSVIDLWASKNSQLDFQQNVPIASVSAELFCMWDDLYHPDSDYFRQSFNDSELKLLSEFDKSIDYVAKRTPKNIVAIKKFIETDEWKLMNNKAIEIKNKLNTVGNKA